MRNHLLEELDAPGEWYLNRKNGIIYFWPPDGINDSDVILPISHKPLIILDNVSHMIIDGLIFEYGRGHGIKIKGGEKIHISNCTIRNVGRYGISIDHGNDHKITNCKLYQIGEGGISLNGGDRQKLTPSNHIAENNDIHHYARLAKTYHPGIYLRGVGQRVTHNHIHNAPHNAIIFKGNDHLIEFNQINDVAQETGDVGVIYTGRDWSARGNVIRYNYIYNTPSRMGKGTMGVYLDDCASGTLIDGNVFFNAGQAVFIGGGRDNTVKNNIFVSCQSALHVDSRAETWAKIKIKKQIKGWDLIDKLKKINYNHPPYSLKYPALASMLENTPLSPIGNSFVKNTISDTANWLDLFQVDRKLITIEDNHVIQEKIFNTFDHMEFTVNKNPRQLFLDFQEIPFKDIGIR